MLPCTRETEVTTKKTYKKKERLKLKQIINHHRGWSPRSKLKKEQTVYARSRRFRVFKTPNSILSANDLWLARR